MTTPPAPSPSQPAPGGLDFPGRTLGIIGLVVAIFANLVGLIISVIALRQSRQAGYKNTPALAGVIVGAVLTVLGIVIAVASILLAVAAGSTYRTY